MVSEPEIKIPDFLLEQYVLGELSKEKSFEIRRLMLESSSVRARVQSIDIANKKFELPLSYNRINEAISKKNKIRFFDLGSIMQSKGFGFAVVACFLVLLVNPLLQPAAKKEVSYIATDIEIARGIEDSIRLKGIRPELQIFRKQGVDVTRLFDKDSVHKNDSLQLSYVSGGDKYGVIFSVDGNGGVTLHYPENSSKPTQIKLNSLTALPYAYELDDAPDFERFFLVTSDHPLNVANIIEKGHDLASDIELAKEQKLILSNDIKQTSILLTKVEK